MGHKHGIGPQSLGASGMNPKSTPCGHPRTMGNYGTPLDFNKGFESLPESVQRKIDPEGKADTVGNYGMEKKTDGTSPMNFNVFENADPRAAVNMMSDMAPTGSGNTSMAAPDLGTPTIPDAASRGAGAPFGGLAGGVVGLLKSKVGNGGFLNRKRKLSRRIATGEPMTPAGPTVNSPGGGAGGAVASAEAAQASADAANSQIDALKEKLSGIRNLLNQTAGMV